MDGAPTAPVRDVVGLVLAGGRALRMGGVDKGLTLYDGRPLIEHVIERIRPQVATLMISANRHVDQYQRYGLVVRDEPPARGERGRAASVPPVPEFAGPLAGVLAGLRAARNDWMLVVPCDAPRLPLNLAERLHKAVAAESTAPAAVARCAGRIEPLFALLHRRLAADLADRLAAGERAMHAWLTAITARAVDFDDDAAFRNINSIDDLNDV